MTDPNSSANDILLNATQRPVDVNNDENQALPFNIGSASLASGIVLAVLAPITVIANGLLLWAIYRDPFRTFRSPTACFLIGLAITDLITGLVPEPMVAACYFLDYLNHPASVHCTGIFSAAGIVAAITTNSTFLLVLAFTTAQYVAVRCPINYKRLINPTGTVVCVLIIWAYTTFFELLGQMGVSRETIEKVDLYLHSTLITLLTLFMYALLHRTFTRQMRSHSKPDTTMRTTSAAATPATPETPAQKDHKRKRRNTVERKFVKINLLLITIFILCSVPTTITWYVYLYWPKMRNNPSLFLTRVIVDNTLYLKFVLDPFVYAWRLPRYRQALLKAIMCET